MKVHSCSVQEVPDKIYEQLYTLNHGSIGLMRPVLVHLKLNDCQLLSNGTVAYVEEHGTIRGWGLVFDVIDQGVKQRLQYLYVSNVHRGKGIGTALAQFGSENNPGLKGHTEYSSCFARAGINQANDHYMQTLRYA